MDRLGALAADRRESEQDGDHVVDRIIETGVNAGVAAGERQGEESGVPYRRIGEQSAQIRLHERAEHAHPDADEREAGPDAAEARAAAAQHEMRQREHGAELRERHHDARGARGRGGVAVEGAEMQRGQGELEGDGCRDEAEARQHQQPRVGGGRDARECERAGGEVDQRRAEQEEAEGRGAEQEVFEARFQRAFAAAESEPDGGGERQGFETDGELEQVVREGHREHTDASDERQHHGLEELRLVLVELEVDVQGRADHQRQRNPENCDELEPLGVLRGQQRSQGDQQPDGADGAPSVREERHAREQHEHAA